MPIVDPPHAHKNSGDVSGFRSSRRTSHFRACGGLARLSSATDTSRRFRSCIRCVLKHRCALRQLLSAPSSSADLGQQGRAPGGLVAAMAVSVASLHAKKLSAESRAQNPNGVGHCCIGRLVFTVWPFLSRRYEGFAKLSARVYGSPSGRTTGEWVLINKAMSPLVLPALPCYR